MPLLHTGVMEADLVVIGAGALGLSTALHAALLGRRTVVAERHTAGSQASGRAAGLFKSVQADELRTRLARRSIDLALTFSDWAGAELAVTRSGSFLIARTFQHKAYLQAEASQSAGWGVDLREAEAGELASRLSYYRGAGTEYALWCPEDVYIEEPLSLIRAYLTAGRLHGVELLESEAVTGVVVSRGQVTGVETTGRSISAPVVVDAAGAWTRQVAELAGGEAAVAPVRHQLLITEPADAVDPADPIARIVDAAVYLRPARGGLMAGGFEAAPLPVDPRTEARLFSTDDVPLDIGTLQAMAGQVGAEVPAAERPGGRASRRAVHDDTRRPVRHRPGAGRRRPVDSKRLQRLRLLVLTGYRRGAGQLDLRPARTRRHQRAVAWPLRPGDGRSAGQGRGLAVRPLLRPRHRLIRQR